MWLHWVFATRDKKGEHVVDTFAKILAMKAAARAKEALNLKSEATPPEPEEKEKPKSNASGNTSSVSDFYLQLLRRK